VATPQAFIDRYFKSRLRVLDDQKKLPQSVLENEYPNLEQYYEKLKDIKCPTLILWGREDKVCNLFKKNIFSLL
jgi:pimeloyl-ACP methyl ester carboxylesterase